VPRLPANGGVVAGFAKLTVVPAGLPKSGVPLTTVGLPNVAPVRLVGGVGVAVPVATPVGVVIPVGVPVAVTVPVPVVVPVPVGTPIAVGDPATTAAWLPFVVRVVVAPGPVVKVELVGVLGVVGDVTVMTVAVGAGVTTLTSPVVCTFITFDG
jgi:hypothetical protein